jgi:hypothetical protein
MLKFTRAQIALLPTSNKTVKLILPNGTSVAADFTRTAAFPYFHGPQLVRWIKRCDQVGQHFLVVAVDEKAAPRVGRRPIAPVDPPIEREAQFAQLGVRIFRPPSWGLDQ